MESFYALLCQTRQRHGNPPQPVKFFREIHRHAIEAHSGHLLLAKHHDTVVAGAVFLHAGQSAIYKYAASDFAFRHVSANNLVLWRALEWYARHGYTRLQLGRTSLGNEGLRRFKRGWGATEYAIKYFRYVRKSRGFVGATDGSSGWQTRIFKFLPQRISRYLGAFAYKHIA
jgi:CelD/BcsL family acetyltransferase involved in cellulose biosynthesis